MPLVSFDEMLADDLNKIWKLIIEGFLKDVRREQVTDFKYPEGTLGRLEEEFDEGIEQTLLDLFRFFIREHVTTGVLEENGVCAEVQLTHDSRLTIGNLQAMIDVFGEPTALYISEFLYLQAGVCIRELGLDITLIIDRDLRCVVPPGSDACIWFPWRAMYAGGKVGVNGVIEMSGAFW